MKGISKGLAKKLAVAGGLALTAYASVTQVDPDQIGLRENFYLATGHDVLKPRIYFQVPFIQYTHKYAANTQDIEFNAGGCRFWPSCDSTKDKNPLRAELVLHYRVLPDAQKLAMHRWAMEGFIMQDGYWLLTRMMNTSANAILGQKSMAEILNNPDQIRKEIYEDLTNRLALNNIPVEIQSLELKGFSTWYTPARSVSYGVTVNPAVPQPTDGPGAQAPQTFSPAAPAPNR